MTTKKTSKKSKKNQPFRINGKFASKNPPQEMVDPRQIQIPFPQGVSVSQKVRDGLRIIHEMRAFGLDNREALEMLKDMYKEATGTPATRPTHQPQPMQRAKGDATQMVPVSNVQASSMTPNFSSVRGFFLTGHQKHPLAKTYLSAEEMGNLIGKTADQMKDPIKKYVNSLGHELPNVQLAKRITEDGGYFDGISAQLDEHNLPTFHIANVGMATWYVMEDGKFVWRNYWHPEVVKGVLKSMGHTLPEKEINLDQLANGVTVDASFEKTSQADGQPRFS